MLKFCVAFGKVPSLYPEFEEASPTFGRIFAWAMTGCRGIEVTSSEEPLDIKGEGAAPILVLGTSRDPATPLRLQTVLVGARGQAAVTGTGGLEIGPVQSPDLA